MHELKVDDNDVYCTDGFVTYSLRYKNLIDANDLTCFLDVDTKNSLNQDTTEFEFLYKKIFGYDNDIIDATRFIFGFQVIEIARMMRFLIASNDNNFVLIHPNMYKVLENIYGIARLNGLGVFICSRPDLNAQIKLLLLYQKISMYGRFGYLKYFIFLPFFLFRLRRRILNKTDPQILYNTNQYCQKICKSRFADKRQESYEGLLPLNLFGFFKNYRQNVRKYKILLKTNIVFQNFCKSNFAMRSLLVYFYSPFLEYYKESIEKFFLLNKNVTTLIQSTDSSPHRYLWAKIANQNNIKTIVTQHGEITEPLVITCITSMEGVFTTRKSFDLYKTNKSNWNKKISYIERVPQEKNTLIKSANLSNVYIFTISYSGYSYDASLVFNHKMIEDVLDLLEGKKVNVVVKLHPSEKASLYTDVFKGISVSDRKINEVIDDIDLAVCGPSTSYEELSVNGVPTYYYEQGLQHKYGFPESNYNKLLEHF